jgi:hypothetical protein
MTNNSVTLLWRDIRRRWFAPCRSVTFYNHLIFAVIIGGGLGVWYEVIFKGLIHGDWEMANISAALFAYFPAIVSVAINDFTQERQPYLRSFGHIAAGVFTVIFLLSVATESVFQLFFALLGSLFAVMFWWVASGDKDCFRDIDYEASTPDPSQSMPGSNIGWRV